MSLGVDAYVKMLFSVLPRGWAWERHPDSTLEKVITSLAEEFARLDARANALLLEFDPLTTNEMLEDYERLVGIPDECQDVAESVVDRQADVNRKLTNRGGATLQFFIDLAAGVGYTVTVNNTFPFRAGHGRAGTPLYGILWAYWFQVSAEDFDLRQFRAGEGRAGDRLRTFRNETLECVIRRAKPAHTDVQFLYGS